MKESENLYDKIRELIGTVPGNVSIMEDNIDVDLQIEYFEYSKRLSSEFDDNWALDQIELLKENDFPVKRKKQILARLATMEDVSAFRAIEAYANDPDKELREWSMLALLESRMHLESHFLEENQVFISTGLGGRENKLRYFVVVIARNREVLSGIHKRIIRNEFSFVLKRYDGEIEDFTSSGFLAAMTMLIPIQHPVNEIFNECIVECNQYGDFLRENCIITNVRKLTFNEVEAFIEKRTNN